MPNATQAERERSQARNRRKTVLFCVAAVAGMAALSYASVPLYDLFCRVTGYGGTTQVAASSEGVEVGDRTITIRFNADTARGMPWRFRPQQREVKLLVGEERLAFYSAYNPTDKPVAGTATYNVSPAKAGVYFNKIDCFCFTEQVLEAGRSVQMPVSFFVDPSIMDDRSMDGVNEITLSYTFFLDEEATAAQSAQRAGPGGDRSGS